VNPDEEVVRMASVNGTDGWDPERAKAVIATASSLPGAMLPVLHALQTAFGYVDERAIPLVAHELNVSRAEVVGVIHFYHDFRTEPPGKHKLRVCRAESCQSMGGEALIDHIADELGVRPGETTRDGRFTVDSVYCLGNCALSPALMLDGQLVGRVSPARFDELVAGVGA
jgi:formate dehydrogenase subunit gamma